MKTPYFDARVFLAHAALPRSLSFLDDDSDDAQCDVESTDDAATTASIGDHEILGSSVANLEPSIVHKIGDSLEAAGFQKYCGAIFAHGELGIVVEMHETIQISIDGVDAEGELTEWVTQQLNGELSGFGERLLEWASLCRAHGEVHDGAADGVVEELHDVEAAGVTLTGNNAWKARLQAGETVAFRGKGNSLHPRIKSGECCKYAPVRTHDDIQEKDIVFCQIKGRYWGHIVKKKTPVGGRDMFQYTISNIHGWENGTCTLPYIYGKVIDHWK